MNLVATLLLSTQVQVQRGKYQFLQSTWDSVAPDEYKGVSPAQAPEDVQDPQQLNYITLQALHNG